MKCRLIATGERAPSWVAQGFAEYQKRLSHWLPFELVEIEPGLRGKGRDPQRAIDDEGRRVLAALPKNAHVVALEVTGKPYSSEQLARRLEHWRTLGRDIALLIGGPEGHAPDVVAAAHEKWSLSPLTLPHMLVGWWWPNRYIARRRCWRTIPITAPDAVVHCRNPKKSPPSGGLFPSCAKYHCRLKAIGTRP